MIGDDVEGLSILPRNSAEYDKIIGLYKIYALMPEQTHSLNVGLVERMTQTFPDTDALVTFEPGIPIGIKTADCVPILIYAPDKKGIAAVHAGWRGTLDGILENTIDVLEEKGCSPAEMYVAFGASISPEYYEVDEDLAEKFRNAGFADFVSYPNGAGTKPHLDLQGVNIERLLRRGVKIENILRNQDCTFSTLDADGNYLYQSYRRNGEDAGRNLTCICLL